MRDWKTQRIFIIHTRDAFEILLHIFAELLFYRFFDCRVSLSYITSVVLEPPEDMTFSTDDGLTLTLPGCTFRFVFSILYYVKYPCNVIHDIVTNLCIVNNNNNNNNALFILHGCHVIIRLE